MDYFDIYEVVLRTVNIERPNDAFALMHELEKLQSIQTALRNLEGDRRAQQDLTNDIIDTLENLIDDGLIVGRITPTKMGKLFSIDRLSTTGHQYLSALSKPSFKQKLKEAIRSQGVPVTVSVITKMLTQLIP